MHFPYVTKNNNKTKRVIFTHSVGCGSDNLQIPIRIIVSDQNSPLLNNFALYLRSGHNEKLLRWGYGHGG